MSELWPWYLRGQGTDPGMEIKLDITQLDFWPKVTWAKKAIPVLRNPVLRPGLMHSNPKLLSVYETMSEIGQKHPIIVVPHEGRYRVYAGNQRLAVALALEWESLDAIVVESEAEAREAVRKNYDKTMSCGKCGRDFYIQHKCTAKNA